MSAISPWLSARAQISGSQPAIECNGSVLSYAELHGRAGETVRRLAELGIGHGDVVALHVHFQGQAVPRPHEVAGDGNVADFGVGVEVVGGVAVVGAIEKADHAVLRPGDKIVAEVADSVGRQEENDQ